MRRLVLAAAMAAAACGGSSAGDATTAQSRSTPAPAATPDDRAFVAAVDALAADALQRGPIAGLSIAVQSRGREVLAKGYGFADVEAQAPATADTSYPIASVSKRLTAAAILRLADQGRLALDDPLSRFFPEARPTIGALTLRNLLQHTSGFTKAGPAPRRAAESVLARGGTARPQGHDWTYSNYNFSLLGLVLEKAAGADYATYVAREIAGPLGLGGTGYCEDGRALPGRGKDYLSTPGSVTATGYWSEARFYAAGGLCSTVRDLVKWEQALQDGRVVGAASLEALTKPARLANGVEVDYAFGTRLGYTGSHRKVGHTGGGQGNKAVLARYPADDVTVVVLLNTERAEAEITATEIEEQVARLFFRLEPPAGRPDPVAVSRVAGDYRAGTRRVDLRADGGVLVVSPPPSRGRHARYVAVDGATFVAENDPSVEMRFFEEGGRVAGYRRYRHGWFTAFGLRADRAGAPAPEDVETEDDEG